MSKYTSPLLIRVFRIFSAGVILLLCDLLFYEHMIDKWSLLDQHNKDYYSSIIGREWNAHEVRSLFGKPDNTSSNSFRYTAYDFSRSETFFPFTEVLLTMSTDHFQRHDITFFFDSNDIIDGSEDSQNEGVFYEE